MKVLEKNMLHGSNIFLSKVFCGCDRKCDYYKSSSVEAGITNLLKELDGFEWYCNLSQFNYHPEIVIKTINYLKLKYPFIPGKVSKLKDGYL